MRAAALISAVALVACTARVAGPPEVHWGVDECSRCHMILSEPRFAGVARGPAGEEERFDDLGCMVAFLAEGRPAEWTAWVRDAATDRWMPASSAWYARDAATHSPMGSGVVAYPSREAAMKAAGGAAVPVSWSELLAARGTPRMTFRSTSPRSSGDVASRNVLSRPDQPNHEPSSL